MPKRILNYLNPKYHVLRMREDLMLMRQAMVTRKVLSVPKNVEELQQLFRGKLFSAFFLSGPFGLVGAAIAGVFQALYRSAWVGLFATMFFVMLVTTIMYQVFWWVDNKRIYMVNGHFRRAEWTEMQRDLWPVHLFGIKTGLTFAAVGVPINAAIIVIVNAIWPGVVQYLPMPVVVMIIDTILVQSTFVRIMGDYFDRHSRILAAKHYDFLARAA